MGIHLIIVDDEPAVCEGVAHRIELMSVREIESVSCFCRGEDALAHIEAHPKLPYLALVDISMRGMNGLEFIRLARASAYCIRFIILSAHSDFAYAQEALRLGADDYLLKPMLFEQFKISVLSSIEKLRRESPAQQQIQKIQEALHSLTFGDAEPLKEAMSGDPLFARWDRYAFFALSEPLSDECVGDRAYERLPFHHEKNWFVHCPDDFDLVRLARELLQSAPAHARIGVSAHGRAEETLVLYHSACAMLRAATLYGVPIAYAPDEQIKRRKMPLSTKEETALERAIRTLDRDYFKRFINQHFADATPAQFTCEAIEAFYTHVVQMLNAAAPQPNIPAKDLTGGIEGLCGMAALRRALLEAFDTVCAALGELLEHSPLDWTMRYIRENLGANVDMAMLANYSDLNYSYFSQLFKKRTGQNFSTYIHDLRMERAVELLQSGHKIQYITEMLGYTNPKNFSRAFRKHYGLSPTHWRRIGMVGIHHKQYE